MTDCGNKRKRTESQQLKSQRQRYRNKLLQLLSAIGNDSLFLYTLTMGFVFREGLVTTRREEETGRKIHNSTRSESQTGVQIICFKQID